MLYLNVSERVMDKWGRTIDLYFSIHLGTLSSELKSVNLLIEEGSSDLGSHPNYSVMVTAIPKVGPKIQTELTLEDCASAIEQCFAQARRYLVRQIRSLTHQQHIQLTQTQSSVTFSDRL